jgi:hypothetical protein
LRSGVEGILPAQNVEADDALELRVEPVGDQLDPRPLGGHVERGGDENPESPLGQESLDNPSIIPR